MKNIITVLALALFMIGGCSPILEQSTSTTPTTKTTEIPAGTGVTYYVSPVGSDTNPGTITEPWFTIQHAADTMVAGDTLLLRGGTYNESVITAHDGNTTEGYITFSAYLGERPIINGANVSESQNGFIIVNNYIRLSGLEIENWNENGIWVENSHHIEISDCKVHDLCCGIGMADGTHDFVVDQVEMYNFDLYGFDASPAWGADNYNGTINDSVAHSARDNSQNVDGFALGHGNQHSFTINRCQAYDVFDGFDISSRDTTLNSCLAYDNWNCGYKLWNDNIRLMNSIGYHNANANVELDWDGKPGIITLQNCTFFDTKTFNIWIENKGDQLRMYNTILAGGDNIGLAFEQEDASNYRGDYNIFQNDAPERAIVIGYELEFSISEVESGDWLIYSGQDEHSFVLSDSEVLFKNLNDWDLHLREGSLAIDNGNGQDAPEEDYEGNTRPYGIKSDIGAYEYVG